jgi:DNA invertase Pin-like site-specific DNA recombinase
MRIGYARVSTDDQTLDLQRDALKRAKCRQIYEEHASGKTTIRPELDACLKSLHKGDTLVVWRLDRLGRSLGDLIHLTTELRSRGVGLCSFSGESRAEMDRPRSGRGSDSKPDRADPLSRNRCAVSVLQRRES